MVALKLPGEKQLMQACYERRNFIHFAPLENPFCKLKHSCKINPPRG